MDDLIVITPEMIEAGVDRLEEFKYGVPYSEIVESVYLYMELEKRR